MNNIKKAFYSLIEENTSSSNETKELYLNRSEDPTFFAFIESICGENEYNIDILDKLELDAYGDKYGIIVKIEDQLYKIEYNCDSYGDVFPYRILAVEVKRKEVTIYE